MSTVATLTNTRLTDIASVRAEFPILQQQVHGQPLAFLDSAASSQRPRHVIQALTDYMSRYHANVHRGVYWLSEEATYAYEQAREKVAHFIGARRPEEIIFTRNTTEAINLVAYAWGDAHVQAGDRILLTLMEHHSNIVPWQLLAERRGAVLDYVALDADGRLDLTHLEQLLTERTRIVAFTHQSNVLGTINPVSTIAALAHAVGALVVVDGAQSVPHMPVNVAELGADFLAFSGHKMCGPTGVGVLWGRYDLLSTMPPFLGGGSMISYVDEQRSTYADVPQRFEAGTPAIGEAIALGAAVDFLNSIGMDAIHQHEQELLQYALQRLATVPNLTLYGPHTAEQRGAALAFTLGNIHPHDIAAVLDQHGIAVRAGHHCTQPLHRSLDVPATVRASMYLYNTADEIDRLIVGLAHVQRMLG